MRLVGSSYNKLRLFSCAHRVPITWFHQRRKVMDLLAAKNIRNVTFITLECLRPVAFAVHPSHIKASSSFAGFPAKNGVINEDDLAAAWCAAEENDEQWLEFDLQEDKEIMAVALQGRYGHSWIKSFYIQYGTNRSTWFCYGSDNGHKVTFHDIFSLKYLLFGTNFELRSTVNPLKGHPLKTDTSLRMTTDTFKPSKNLKSGSGVE